MPSALIWTVKRSFVTYILGSAGGVVLVDGGATGSPEGPYRFAADEDAVLPAPGGEPLRLRGTVHFRGHGGMLDLPISEPWIEAVGDSYRITIVDPEDATARVSFVSVDGWTEDADGHHAGRTALTADGADLFFGPYSEGTEFDAPSLTRTDA